MQSTAAYGLTYMSLFEKINMDSKKYGFATAEGMRVYTKFIGVFKKLVQPMLPSLFNSEKRQRELSSGFGSARKTEEIKNKDGKRVASALCLF